MLCSRLLRIKNSRDHRQVWTANFMHSAAVTYPPGFLTDVENMGGRGGLFFKIWWRGGLESIHGGLKTLLKNTCERVHLLVKLQPITQQACRFTKIKLIHTYFPRILARFKVIIYCFFSRNHFLEGGFMFQWRGKPCPLCQ